jgi:signal transduction histidine kinase
VVRRERLRIARDLHDQVGGYLTGIALRSGQIRRALDGGGQQVGEQLATIEATAGRLVDNLSEIVWLARPANDTFEHLVRYLLDYAVKVLEPAEIACQIEVPVDLPSVPLDSDLRQDLLMSVKEALHNVLKHARASRVTFRVEVSRGRVGLEVEDNGVGLATSADQVRGNGLRHMRERMGRHGGGVELTSSEGRTRVRFSVPMGSRVRMA